MQGKETKNLDHYATSEQGKAQTTVKSGLKDYSKKFSKESSQSRKKGTKAGAGKKRQKDTQQTAYKIADLLPKETIKKLKEMKQ